MQCIPLFCLIQKCSYQKWNKTSFIPLSPAVYSVCLYCVQNSSQLSSVQSLSCVRLFATPWIAARQAYLSVTNSRGVYSNSCPSSQWCHPAILSSVVPFSSCPQSLPASRSFPISQLFAWGGQSIGVSASASVLPMNTRDLSPSGWTGWISLQSKGLSRVFSNTSVQKHQFFGTQLSSQSNSHNHRKKHSLDQTDLCWQSKTVLLVTQLMNEILLLFSPSISQRSLTYSCLMQMMLICTHALSPP